MIADLLPSLYERFVAARPALRKANGVYYTPAPLVTHVVRHTLGRLLKGKTPPQVACLRILDPACGTGAFLLGAYRYLLDWHRDWYRADGPENHRTELYHDPGGDWHLTLDERARLLVGSVHGVDLDAQALVVTKRLLLREALVGQTRRDRQRPLPDLGSNLRCGNALIGPDFAGPGRERLNPFNWDAAFPWLVEAGGFDAVIGNPPWGQKAVAADAAVKHYLRQRYPSCRGIHDLFRPFIEQGVRLLAPGGMFGMVLPDIVLLKDYSQTRRYLLENLSLEAIDWWGAAFASAVIDTATILGRKQPAPTGHRVRAAVHNAETPCRHLIPQADFWANPRLVFNLHLTPKKRRLLGQLEQHPRLGDFFEAHEGVHSGNLRAELFVPARLDASCRELYFGRNELRPYHLDWHGRYLRLAALPAVKTPQRYANLGRPEWHAADKLLVRRTGDRVLAAVDRTRRYASNNFFLVLPRRSCALDLDGLCALLNSRVLTWYFRTVEPRRGRAFAELKIKHLSAFPLPLGAGCWRLNRLGRQRAAAVGLPRSAEQLDSRFESLVCQLFGLPEAAFEE